MTEAVDTAPRQYLVELCRRGWRVFAALLSFAFFGLVGLVYGGVFFPVLRLLVRDPVRRRVQSRRLVGLFMRNFAAFMRRVGLIEVQMRGAEYLLTPGAVIAPNHPTLIDVVLLLAVAPQLDLVVKDALRRNLFTRATVVAAGYIVNADGRALIDRCADVLRDGRSVLIFPEGTRTTPGQPVELVRGACSIVLRADGLVVPVVIRCVPPALSKQHRWYDLPARPLQFDIEAYAPWTANDYRRVEATPEQRVGALLAGDDTDAKLRAHSARPDAIRYRPRAAHEMTAALELFYRNALAQPLLAPPPRQALSGLR